jgi:hypothetical protein
MDSGSSSSYLDVENIKQFERDGKRWVRFEVQHPGTGELQKFEHKIKRTVAVSQSGSEEERYPVIKLGITIGRINQAAEFMLSDRKHKSYQINIGRDILQDVMVVDVSENNRAPYELPDDKASGEGDSG